MHGSIFTRHMPSQRWLMAVPHGVSQLVAAKCSNTPLQGKPVMPCLQAARSNPTLSSRRSAVLACSSSEDAAVAQPCDCCAQPAGASSSIQPLTVSSFCSTQRASLCSSADVTIICSDNEKVLAHSQLLCLASPVWQKALHGMARHSNKEVSLVIDCSADSAKDMELLLDMLYPINRPSVNWVSPKSLLETSVYWRCS